MVFSTGIYPDDDRYRLSEQMLEIIKFYEEFEIDDATGQALAPEEMLATHYNAHNKLRVLCWKHNLKGLALSHVGEVQSRPDLKKIFSKMPYALLKEIAADLCLLDVRHDSILKELDDVVLKKIEEQRKEKDQAT